MKNLRNSLALCLFPALLLLSCASNGIDTSDVVDVVPEIGMDSSAAKVVVNWGSLSGDALTSAQDQVKYFSCSPILKGISANKKGLKVGDSYASTLMGGIAVTTTISRDSAKNIVYRGKMDDGSYTLTYYPKTRTFDFSQSFYFEETSGSISGTTDVATKAYVHCEMSNVQLSDEGYFHAPMKIYTVQTGGMDYMLVSTTSYAEYYYGLDTSGSLISAAYIKGGKMLISGFDTPTAANQDSLLALCQTVAADDATYPAATGTPFPFLFVMTHGTTDTLSINAPYTGTTLPFTSILP